VKWVTLHHIYYSQTHSHKCKHMLTISKWLNFVWLICLTHISVYQYLKRKVMTCDQAVASVLPSFICNNSFTDLHTETHTCQSLKSPSICFLKREPSAVLKLYWKAPGDGDAFRQHLFVGKVFENLFFFFFLRQQRAKQNLGGKQKWTCNSVTTHKVYE